jgi:glycosyltransferase involved in cell wall biosynthesis
LARNIARLLDDDGLRQRLANAGYERIQTLTWKRSTDLLEEFVRKHVARGVAEC